MFINFKKILKAISNLLDKFSENPTNYTTLNTVAERELFYHYIGKCNCKNYLEFGAGGSTFDVLKRTDADVYSVESSLSWIKRMKSWKFIRQNISKGKLHFIYANIGKTKKWGYPSSETKQECFLSYTQLYTQQVPFPSIVLVDGRFRVACVLSIILNVKPNDNLIILFHDFWNREYYHVVLKYLETIDRADSLGVFKVKENINKDEIFQLYEKYKYISE